MWYRPPESWSEAKRIIAAILHASGGCVNGSVRLNKAFYMAHLFHWVLNRGMLTTHPVVRMPKGPAIDDGTDILEEMRRDGAIKISHRLNGPYKETVFQLVGEPPAVTECEMEAIRSALDWVGEKSASQLSAETHEFSRSWRSSQDGQRIDIYLDLLSDEEFDQNQKAIGDARNLLDATFPD